MPQCSKCKKEVPVLTSKGLCGECSVNDSPELKISIDRSTEIEGLQKELLEEKEKNESLASTLSFIAQTDFETQKQDIADKLHISPELIDSPERLQSYKELLQQKQREADTSSESHAPLGKGETISWSQNLGERQSNSNSNVDRAVREAQNSVLRPSERSYDSVEEMITDLKKESKSGSEHSKEARLALSKMTRKVLHDEDHVREYEVDGSLRDFLSGHENSKPKLRPVTKKESD